MQENKIRQWWSFTVFDTLAFPNRIADIFNSLAAEITRAVSTNSKESWKKTHGMHNMSLGKIQHTMRWINTQREADKQNTGHKQT